MRKEALNIWVHAQRERENCSKKMEVKKII